MKIVRLGKGPDGDIFCKIQIRPDGELTISGVEGPMRNGNCRGGCGQIDMHLRGEQESIALAASWTTAMLAQFFEVWDRWHLNHMRAECEHQRARGETWPTHPDVQCPECGYKLGHAWLKEELPQDVRDFLASLPDTDTTPAWV